MYKFFHSTNPKNKVTKFRLELLIVFVAVFLIYISNLPQDFTKDKSKNGSDIVITSDGYRNTLTSVDNVPNAFLPYLILERNTIYFDPILNVAKRFDDLEAPHPYFLLPTEKGLISVYPLASSIITLPFYVLPLLFKRPDLNYYENVMSLLVMFRLVAAFLTSIAVTLMYASLSLISNRRFLNLLLMAFFAFGTSLFTIASRGVWMHTTSLVFITLLVYMLLRFKLTHKIIFIMGLLMGILVLIRLTNLIVVVPIGIYIITRDFKNLRALSLGALPSLVALLAMNWFLYGNVFTNAYVARDDFHWTTSYIESLPGYFVSPARGFLFLSPTLLLGFVTLFQFKRLSALYKTFIIICLLQILVMGKWWAWEGANAFGARMLTEILTFSLVLTATIVVKIKNKVALALVFITIVYSISVHSIGVYRKKSRCAEYNNWSFSCLIP